jgi:hypothetical protein
MKVTLDPLCGKPTGGVNAKPPLGDSECCAVDKPQSMAGWSNTTDQRFVHLPSVPASKMRSGVVW